MPNNKLENFNEVPNSPKLQDKLWGVTRHLYVDDTHECCHASIKQGGYSSRHLHKNKTNKFYVLSGTLKVHIYGNDQLLPPLRTYILHPGQQVVIPENIWHQFEAVTDVELIEIYWTQLRLDDIVRLDEGGILNGDRS